MAIYRVHYVYVDEAWEDVEADSPEEARSELYGSVFDDIQEVVDCYEVTS